MNKVKLPSSYMSRAASWATQHRILSSFAWISPAAPSGFKGSVMV